MGIPYSFIFLISYVVGIIISKYHFSFGVPFFILASFIFLRKRFLLIFLSLSFFFLGSLLYKVSSPQYELFHKKYHEIYAEVKDVRFSQKYIQYVIKADISKEEFIMSVGKSVRYEVGDVLLLRGVEYYPLENNNIWSESIIYKIKVKEMQLVGHRYQNRFKLLRLKFKKYVDHILGFYSDDKKEFIKAITIGEKLGLNKDIKEIFSETGTSHLLAISGLHVSLLIGIFINFLPFRKVLSRIIFLPILIFYGYIIGDNPPIWRVIGEYIFLLLAFLFRREEDTLNAVFWVALINLIIFPLKLFNLSFQLSYLSMLGLLYKPQFPKFLPKFFQEIWESSFWLMIFLSPLYLYYFKKICFISILSNIFSIPIFYIILIFSFLLFFINIYPINHILVKLLSILIDILLNGLQFILSHYKISLVISLFLIFLPIIMRKREDYELLGV
uniref:ComEC/Rec2 family competence protein n=1 Tax=Dictyoglomus thermophilum TaxID=14 RepID=A0A7C3MIY8_DICTH